MQSDPMSVLSPPLGPHSEWCVTSPSQGRDSLWSGVAPVWATCTLPGLWCCFTGIWHINQGGSARCTGAEEVGLAHFAIGGPLWEGPYSTWRKAGPSEGWIHKNTVLGICAVQASSVKGTGFLWDFGWGMGKGDGTSQCLCSLSSVF